MSEGASAGFADHGFFRLLRGLDLPPADYAVFGSGPLLVRGIIDDAGDLDVVCRGEAWTRVRQLGEAVPGRSDGVEIVAIGPLTFGTQWAMGTFAIAELIDTAEFIAGLPFAGLEHVRAYKEIRGSRRDLIHLRLLDLWAADQ